MLYFEITKEFFFLIKVTHISIEEIFNFFHFLDILFLLSVILLKIRS